MQNPTLRVRVKIWIRLNLLQDWYFAFFTCHILLSIVASQCGTHRCTRARTMDYCQATRTHGTWSVRNEPGTGSLSVFDFFPPHNCVGFLFLDLPPPRVSSSAASSSHTIFHTQLCHAPPFTHNFVTHHLSHTTLTHIFVTHTHTQLCRTHTHTTLSRTIFHTQLRHAPPFTHTTLSHTHTPSLTSIFVTHSFVTTHHLWHTTLSHTFFHTHTHTTSTFTHISLSHTILSHQPLCHTQLCHTPSFTHNFVTHNFVTPSLSHTIFHTHLCHTHTHHNFVNTHAHTHTHHLSHTTLTPSFVWRGRCGTYGTWLGLVAGLCAVAPRHCWVAGVALGDIYLGFTWQAWYLDHRPSFCVAGVALMVRNLRYVTDSTVQVTEDMFMASMSECQNVLCSVKHASHGWAHAHIHLQFWSGKCIWLCEMIEFDIERMKSEWQWRWTWHSVRIITPREFRAQDEAHRCRPNPPGHLGPPGPRSLDDGLRLFEVNPQLYLSDGKSHGWC